MQISLSNKSRFSLIDFASPLLYEKTVEATLNVWETKRYFVKWVWKSAKVHNQAQIRHWSDLRSCVSRYIDYQLWSL